MLADLEDLLRETADEEPDLYANEQGVHLTAGTCKTYTSTSDAMAAAEGLLDTVLALGYRLLGGLVGAEPAVESDGAGPWRGRLVNLLLIKEPDSPDAGHLRSV
jgi:hypothetical protein